MHPVFNGGRIVLDGADVTEAIRTEEVGLAASVVAAYPSVRAELLDLQRRYAQAPGLVADGRDMASVVFPDAPLKVFLTATPEARAMRRYNQLIEKEFLLTFQILPGIWPNATVGTANARLRPACRQRMRTS